MIAKGIRAASAKLAAREIKTFFHLYPQKKREATTSSEPNGTQRSSQRT
jgi:hypothetical protein